MNRFIVLDDPKVKSLIQSKEKLATEVINIGKEIEKLEEKRNKLVLKIERYNGKADPLLKKYLKEDELGEFEKHQRVYLEGDELRLEIIDELEEYKVYIKQAKEEAKKNKDGDKQPTKD